MVPGAELPCQPLARLVRPSFFLKLLFQVWQAKKEPEKAGGVPSNARGAEKLHLTCFLLCQLGVLLVGGRPQQLWLEKLQLPHSRSQRHTLGMTFVLRCLLLLWPCCAGTGVSSQLFAGLSIALCTEMYRKLHALTLKEQMTTEINRLVNMTNICRQHMRHKALVMVTANKTNGKH